MNRVKKVLIGLISLALIGLMARIDFNIPSAQAALTLTSAPTSLIAANQTIKSYAPNNQVSAIKFQLTGSASSDTLTSVSVLIIDGGGTSGQVTANDIASLKVFKSSDETFDTNDILVGTQTTVNIGSATTITVDEGTNLLGANSAWYFVVVTASSTAIQGHKMKIGIPDGGINGLSGGLDPTTVEALTIDAAPRISSVVAGTDRVIINFSEPLDGATAIDCANYQLTVNGTNVLSTCGTAPDAPFVDFQGDRVVLRNLSLTAGSSFSLVLSNITDLTSNQISDGVNTASGTIVDLPVPQITNVSPTYGAVGATVTITGTNFGSTQGDGLVLFSGGFTPETGPLPPVQATTYNSWSDTQIEVVVPSGAKSGPINVLNNQGLLSDISDNTFFDVLMDYYVKIQLNGTDVDDPTNLRIVIGSPRGLSVYQSTDSNVTYNSTTHVYKISGVSSVGFVWAFDASGNRLPAPGVEMSSNTSADSPQVLALAGTATRKVSGTITLGDTCQSYGQNKQVAIFAILEGGEDLMEPGHIEPVFFKTDTNCQTTYNFALESNGTYTIEAHLPPETSSDIPLIDPAGQSVTITDDSLTATANFTFEAANRKIHGRIVDKNGNPLTAQKYQEIWVWAYQPMENGKGTASQPDSSGYFDLYVDEGAYKIGVGGPMMPSPVEKDILVDSTYTLTANKGPTIRLEPPTTYISGYVKDAAGNAVSGVNLYAWCENGPGGGHALSDSQGYYQMYVPPCDNYHVGGFSKTYGQLAEQTNVSVRSGENPTVNFTLDNSNFVTISGTVTKGGSALSGADVWITQGEFGEGISWGQTQSDGTFSLKVRSDLSNLYLHCGVPGRGELGKMLLNNGQPISENLTNQNISANIATLEIRITPKGAFSKIFIGAHGSLGGGFTETNLTTDAENYDKFLIEVPRPTSGSATYVIDGGIPGYGPLPQQTVSVASTDTSKTISIDLGSDFYTVSGTVSGDYQDALVWAAGETGGAETRVNSNGTYSLKLKAGTYDMGVAKPGYTGSLITNLVVNQDLSSQNLSLTQNSQTITGRVTQNGEGVDGAWVWADNGAGGWSGTTSEPDGTFSLSVGDGEWKIEAAAEGYRSTAPVRASAGASGVEISLTQVSGYQNSLKSQPIKPTDGGIVQTDDVKIEIPKGALGTDSNDAQVKIQETTKAPDTNNAEVVGGKGKEIVAYDSNGRAITTLASEATLEFIYTKAELLAAGIDTLAKVRKMKIGYWDSTSNNWTEIPTVIIYNPTDASSFDEIITITLKGSTDHFSTFAPIVPTSAEAPDTPTGLTATAGDGQITLSWSASSGATKYNIYRKSGTQYPYLTQVTGTSYTDTGLTNGNTYYYKVSALDDNDNESAATSAVSATPQVQGGAGPLWLVPQVIPSAEAEEVEEVSGETVSEEVIPEETSTTTEEIKPIDLTQLPAIAQNLGLLEGDLIRAKNDIKVYVIKGGWKRWLPSPKIFDFYGHLAWSKVKEVTQEVIDSFKEAFLIREKNDYKVYQVDENLNKHWLDMSPREFESAGYQWSEIYIVNQKELNFYPDGEIIR